jgi:hypothetical protein
MRGFYVLVGPLWSSRAGSVYDSATGRRYAGAEETYRQPIPVITCPVNPEHQRSAPRQADLEVELTSARLGDFTWAIGAVCVTERVLALLGDASVSGFEPRPVTVEALGRRSAGAATELGRLWELRVTGCAGRAHEASGIREIDRCDACRMVDYSSWRSGIFVDERRWDGTDICRIEEWPPILVTEKVRDLIVRERLTNCALFNAAQYDWHLGWRPEDQLGISTDELVHRIEGRVREIEDRQRQSGRLPDDWRPSWPPRNDEPAE